MTTLTSFDQLAETTEMREARETEHLRARVADAVIRGTPVWKVRQGLRVVPQHFQADPVVAAFVWLASVN